MDSLHTEPLEKPHSDIKVLALLIFIVLPITLHCVISLLFSLMLKKKPSEILLFISQIIGNEAEGEGG